MKQENDSKASSRGPGNRDWLSWVLARASCCAYLRGQDIRATFQTGPEPKSRRPKAARSLALSLVLLVLGAGRVMSQQKSVEASITLPPALARVLTDYEKGWQAGDAAALASLFTEDGLALPSGQPPVKGRSAIRKLYTSPGSPLSLRAIAYAINGNVGYIIGAYSSEKGTPDEGKFTLTLRKRHGRWLIASDMDNLNRRETN